MVWNMDSIRRESAFSTGTLVCAMSLLRAGGTHLDAADHGTRGHAQDHDDRFGDVLGSDHPASVAGTLGGTAREAGVHASGHDCAHADVIVAMVQHRSEEHTSELQ